LLICNGGLEENINYRHNCRKKALENDDRTENCIKRRGSLAEVAFSYLETGLKIIC
jgi:hypothetical protein